MASLTDSANFAQDIKARGVIIAAYTQAAVSITFEDETLPNHAERLELAHQVLTSPPMLQEPFAWAVSTNQTVVDKWAAGDYESAAGDLPYVISTIWDAVALARATR